MTKKDTKKEAERRQTHGLMKPCCGTAARPAGRARLSGFHHGSCLGASGPFGSTSGQASWDAVATAFAGRALPVPTSPSPVNAPHAPAVIPVGLIPEAA